MPNDDSPVGAAVRAELARARISGRQLARDLGWDSNYVSRRTSGTVQFRVDELQRIADHLGIPLQRLIDPPTPTERATA